MRILSTMNSCMLRGFLPPGQNLNVTLDIVGVPQGSCAEGDYDI